MSLIQAGLIIATAVLAWATIRHLRRDDNAGAGAPRRFP